MRKKLFGGLLVFGAVFVLHTAIPQKELSKTVFAAENGTEAQKTEITMEPTGHRTVKLGKLGKLENAHGDYQYFWIDRAEEDPQDGGKVLEAPVMENGQKTITIKDAVPNKFLLIKHKTSGEKEFVSKTPLEEHIYGFEPVFIHEHKSSYTQRLEPAKIRMFDPNDQRDFEYRLKKMGEKGETFNGDEEVWGKLKGSSLTVTNLNEGEEKTYLIRMASSEGKLASAVKEVKVYKLSSGDLITLEQLKSLQYQLTKDVLHISKLKSLQGKKSRLAYNAQVRDVMSAEPPNHEIKYGANEKDEVEISGNKKGTVVNLVADGVNIIEITFTQGEITKDEKGKIKQKGKEKVIVGLSDKFEISPQPEGPYTPAKEETKVENFGRYYIRKKGDQGAFTITNDKKSVELPSEPMMIFVRSLDMSLAEEEEEEAERAAAEKKAKEAEKAKREKEQKEQTKTETKSHKAEGKKEGRFIVVKPGIQDFSEEDRKITVVSEGHPAYTITVKGKFTEGDKGKIFSIKDGRTVLVNSETYQVTEGMEFFLEAGKDYVFLSEEESEKREKEILSDLTTKKKRNLSPKKKIQIKLNPKFDVENIGKIRYSYDSKVIKVSKKGYVKAKVASGQTKVKVRVTLKNGAKKNLTVRLNIR